MLADMSCKRISGSSPQAAGTVRNVLRWDCGPFSARSYITANRHVLGRSVAANRESFSSCPPSSTPSDCGSNTTARLSGKDGPHRVSAFLLRLISGQWLWVLLIPTLQRW